MKKAAIVSIGDELLTGAIVDSNSAYLSKQLLSIAVPTVSSFTAGDDIDSIVRTLGRAIEDADFIIITGGLGPTDDDITRQAAAEFLGCGLQLKEDLLEKISAFFSSKNISMPQRNKVQAYIPETSVPIFNDSGTAPGFMAEKEGKIIFSLPGVPSEMKHMFEHCVLPEIKKAVADQAIVARKLKCFGAGESTVAELLGDLMQRGRNPLIDCTVSESIITLNIIATAKNREEAETKASEDEERIRGKLGDLVFGIEDQTLAEVVGEQLVKENKTIAVAESCTGGILSKLIVDVPGASRYFSSGWITYSNQAKINELGVQADLIEKYGAVSEQVAEAMAIGAKKKAKSDFSIAITGIAGPLGGTKEKPVGLVYISVCSDKKRINKRFVFSHDREAVRRRAALTALNLLRLEILC